MKICRYSFIFRDTSGILVQIQATVSIRHAIGPVYLLKHLLNFYSCFFFKSVCTSLVAKSVDYLAGILLSFDD